MYAHACGSSCVYTALDMADFMCGATVCMRLCVWLRVCTAMAVVVCVCAQWLMQTVCAAVRIHMKTLHMNNYIRIINAALAKKGVHKHLKLLELCF